MQGKFVLTDDVICGFSLGASWLCHASETERMTGSRAPFLTEVLGEK
jgi:hypothetical protein